MIIDGKKTALGIRKEIKSFIEKNQLTVGLAFIIVGDNPASKVYVGMKEKACKSANIFSKVLHLPADVSNDRLIKEIEQFNHNPAIHGILVQLPLPPHLDTAAIMETIDPHKDVDGFHPMNMGQLLSGTSKGFVPCTPLGIQKLLQEYQIETEGRHVVILGRSNIVGKPLAALLVQKQPYANATVTIVHSKSHNLKNILKEADILIAAIGRPQFVTQEMVKKGAVVIDVGINRVHNKLVGDVDFEQLKDHCSHITPVPGGVGPMTIAMLLSNTLLSCQRT